MTIVESLKSKLESQGLFPDQADAVLEILKSENPIMGNRWNDDEGDYPNSLISVLWVAAQSCAVRWIDKNVPKHWARVVFAQNSYEAPADTPQQG